MRLWFLQEDCRSCPVPLSSTRWALSTVCFLAAFCKEDRWSSKIYLPGGSHAKVRVKDGTSEGSRRVVSLSLCLLVISSQQPAAHAGEYTRHTGQKGSDICTLSCFSHCDPLTCLFWLAGGKHMLLCVFAQ